MRKAAGALVLAFVFVVGSACANDKPVASSGDSKAVSAEPAAVSPAAAAPEDSPDWIKVATTPNCQCSDGTEFHFWMHRGTSDRLVFFLEGGGACFSAQTCGPETPSFNRNLSKDTGDSPADGGIFDLSNDKNPFRDDSIVFVPYCTGDLHLGNAVHDYGDGVVIHHNGATNSGTALTAAAAAFPGMKEVVVAGSSAGSAPTPVYAGLAYDMFPSAKVTSIADGSGAFPGTEGITLAVAALWGSESSLPRWPETAGDPMIDWSLPGLYVQATKHTRDVTFAKIDTAYDETQQAFVNLAGFPGDDLMTMIDENTAAARDGGAEIASWVGPGELHTILGRDELYTTKVEGNSLLEWITGVVDGDKVDNVHCAGACGKPA
jgi:hypothetical protein